MTASGNVVAWLFAYTPVFQFLVLYIWFYRYEVTRIFHPSLQWNSPKAWTNVLSQLGLLEEAVEAKSESKVLPYVAQLLVPTTTVSATLSLLVAPLITTSNPLVGRLGLAVPILLQFLPAIYAIIFVSKMYLGPLPLRPDWSRLRQQNRESARVRHLADQEM